MTQVTTENKQHQSYELGETLFLTTEQQNGKQVFPTSTPCVVLKHNSDKGTVNVNAMGEIIEVKYSDLTVVEPENPLLPFASVDSRPSQVVSMNSERNKKDENHREKKSSKPKTTSIWKCCFSKSTIDSESEEPPKTSETSSVTSSRSSLCHIKAPPSPGNIASPPRPDFQKPGSLAGSMKEQKDVRSPLKVSFSGEALSKLNSENDLVGGTENKSGSIPIKAITASSSSSGKLKTDESRSAGFDSREVWDGRNMNSTVELLAASAASEPNISSPPVPLNTPASPLPLEGSQPVLSPPFSASSSSKIARYPDPGSSYSSTARTAPVSISRQVENEEQRHISPFDEGRGGNIAPTPATTPAGGLDGTANTGVSEISRTLSRDSGKGRRRRSSSKEDGERRSSSRRSRSRDERERSRDDRERRRRKPPELEKVPETTTFIKSLEESTPLVSPPASTFCVPPAAIPVDSKLSTLQPATAMSSARTMTSMASSLEIISVNPVSSSSDTTARPTSMSSVGDQSFPIVDELFGRSDSLSAAPYHKVKKEIPPVKVTSPVVAPTPLVRVTSPVVAPTPLVKVTSPVVAPTPLVKVTSPVVAPTPLVKVTSPIVAPTPLVRVTSPVVADTEPPAAPPPILDQVKVSAATTDSPLQEMLSSPQFSSPRIVEPGGLVMTASITKTENEFIGIDVEQETLIIKSIAPDGAAARAGLDWRFIGMRLSHINGKELRSIRDAAKLSTESSVTIICVIPLNGENHLAEQYNKGWHDGFVQVCYR